MIASVRTALSRISWGWVEDLASWLLGNAESPATIVASLILALLTVGAERLFKAA